MEFTKEEKEILLSIKKHIEDIEEDLGCLSKEKKDEIEEQFIPSGSLNYCIRWGTQAIEDLTDCFFS